MFDGKHQQAERSAETMSAIQEGLDALHIGLTIFDARLELVAFNEAFLTMLDVPCELARLGAPLEEFFRLNATRGEYGPVENATDIEALVAERLALARKFEPHSFQRSRPDGSVIEVLSRPLASGCFVTTYTDISDMSHARQVLEEKERQMARHLEDIDLERAMVEQQAQQMVHIAEDLAERNKEIEKSRRHSDYQARHDDLTGLPNRRYFYDYLQQTLTIAGAAGAGKALLFVDLDNFKQVNDRLGHDVGDALLRRVALRLTSSVRDSDFVTRLGGDEFAVLAAVKHTTGAEGVLLLAERILDALLITLDETEPPISIGASIGVALFPQDGGSREALLQTADKAMYEAKNSGRHRIVFAQELDKA